MQSSDDGLSLVGHAGGEAGQLTVGSELNMLVGNIGTGGVHYRSDYVDSPALGEAVAISVLCDQRGTFAKAFQGFTFTRFGGSRITV